MTASVTDEDAQPICAENLPDRRAHMVVDTGWMMLPTGWQFEGDGVRCPQHVTVEGA